MDNTELKEDSLDPSRWMMLFESTRQQPEIVFDRLYAGQFKHGTNGHNERLIISRLADLVELLVAEVPGVSEKVEELLANNQF